MHTKYRTQALVACAIWVGLSQGARAAAVRDLRCEYLSEPVGIDAARPRLSWAMESDRRGERQTAYQIQVASAPAALAAPRFRLPWSGTPAQAGLLWDSGKVESGASMQIEYGGRPLTSGADCFWKVRVWDRDGEVSPWSEPARWRMGLLAPEDWKAQWISFRDGQRLPEKSAALYLPPARHYRKAFSADRKVVRATLFASALGICDLHLNGRRVDDTFFQPGWSDYRKRAYYRTWDVTAMVRQGPNAIGAVVADGWYAGYVGYALLCGYGPQKLGRNLYGKTPALLLQLEVEYADGSRETIGTDASWQVTDKGPHREADFLMGESYDARLELTGWDRPGYAAEGWETAIPAGENGSLKVPFFEPGGAREVELGFQRPGRLQAYAAQPIRVVAELPAQRVTEPAPGVHVYDLGQNFAGVIRLKVRGPAGARVQVRYGEMLHADGRLMTENLRRARATDFYTLRGDPGGETWIPRFTYHGFQYVELSGLPGRPDRQAVTGLVLHNDMPLVGAFACSDPVMTRFGQNALWTQRANFLEVPTDCPQRDERLGWMGDAQVYAGTAARFADVAAFFTKWLDDVEEAQRADGPYPDYAPYPMAHGKPGATYGTAWTDAGIICPWTVWQVYGDTRVIARHWESMRRFMAWRRQRDPQLQGATDGNDWGDWLNVNEPTPIAYIDQCYHALDARLMAEMAEALGATADAAAYRALFGQVCEAFRRQHIRPDGSLDVATQTAQALALWVGVIPEDLTAGIAAALAGMIRKNDDRMATGFLGTRVLLDVLTQHGHHDLAVRLFQSRRYPSWGYEVVNGATTVWERWDSYTKEFGFNGAGGNQNAGMNSFNHYSFGAVMSWAFRELAGVDTEGPGYRRIRLRPRLPAASGPGAEPLTWVKASYRHPLGAIVSNWKREGDRLLLDVTIPANTVATVHVPAGDAASVTESGRPAAQADAVKFLRMEAGAAVYEVGAGSYRFVSRP